MLSGNPLLSASDFPLFAMVIREIMNLWLQQLRCPAIYMPLDVTSGAAANLSGLPYPSDAIGKEFTPAEALGN